MTDYLCPTKQASRAPKQQPSAIRHRWRNRSAALFPENRLRLVICFIKFVKNKHANSAPNDRQFKPPDWYGPSLMPGQDIIAFGDHAGFCIDKVPIDDENQRIQCRITEKIRKEVSLIYIFFI